MECHRGLARLSILWYAEGIACDVDISVQIADTVEDRNTERPQVRVQNLRQIFGPRTERSKILPAPGIILAATRVNNDALLSKFRHHPYLICLIREALKLQLSHLKTKF